jgi:hypothetical protein
MKLSSRWKNVLLGGLCCWSFAQAIRAWELRRQEPKLIEKAKEIIRPAGILTLKSFSFRQGIGVFLEASEGGSPIEWEIDLYRASILNKQTKKKPGTKARAYNE